MRFAKTTDYVDNGDGTVTDTRTGLMWKQYLEGQVGADCEVVTGQFNWDDAIKIPAELNKRGFAGYYDWRIPTIKELESLVMRGRVRPSICAEVFPNIPAYYDPYVWSCSPNTINTSFAWGVCFGYGCSYDYCRSSCNSVRLVRGGR